MRVTNQMSAANLLLHLNSLRNRTSNLTDQISSGQRITRLSADPTAGAEVLRVRSHLEVMKGWESNLANARSWLSETESALDHMTTLMQRVRELGVAGANGTLSGEQRANMAIEVDEIVSDLLFTLNGKGTDGALFGGFRTDLGVETATELPLFSMDPEDGMVTYNGDNGSIRREVGPGITVEANLSGERFVQSVDLLQAVWQLSQDLKKGPADAASAQQLGSVEQALTLVVGLRSEVGARVHRVEQIESRLIDSYVHLNGLLEQAQGVDMEKAILELTNAENTYRAALQVGSRIIPPTLADFLR